MGTSLLGHLMVRVSLRNLTWQPLHFKLNNPKLSNITVDILAWLKTTLK